MKVQQYFYTPKKKTNTYNALFIYLKFEEFPKMHLFIIHTCITDSTSQSKQNEITNCNETFTIHTKIYP